MLNPFRRPTNVEMHDNRFRNARFARFLELVDQTAKPGASVRILDLGGTVDDWILKEELWGARDFHITLLNMFPQEVPDDRFASVVGNACATGLADNAFDVVYSNSVIEHVGRWKEMSKMAGEIRRLAPHHFVQTPNYWFPVEAHSRFPLFNVIPEPWRLSLLLSRGAGFYAKSKDVDEAMGFIEDAILLDRRRFSYLFPDSLIERERVFGLTKSLIAIR
ncbi:MAG: methyltransferase domain-containing protein [Hyphomicrobiaceae bacterium]